ncbi:hypothetical protein ACWFMI_15805 [Nocardiopsis terrae]
MAPPAADETSTDAGTAQQSPPGTADEETRENPPEGTRAPASVGYSFGESAAFPHPVGAYEWEFEGEEDVVYTVDDVLLGAPGRVEFTLTVEVPQLGRVFGTGNLEVRCSQGKHSVSATTEAPLGELETGTHSTDMVCEFPDSPDSVLVSVVNGEDEADFRGPVR